MELMATFPAGLGLFGSDEPPIGDRQSGPSYF
jgi:hypothetical protein